MSTKDIHIYESGSGGEMKILNGDLLLTETLYQTIYLALFGGNLNQSEWWGNELLFPEQNSKRFISQTENTLISTALNSRGRQLIQQAVESDLEFISENIDLNISVSIESIYSVKIKINITSTNEGLELVWNNAEKELIINKNI